MLINGGTVVNLLSYAMFKKLEQKDDELMKTNMTLNDVGGGGGNPMEAKGIVSTELTVGSKSLPIAFFIIEV
jgi:hypothetical protein